MQYTHEHLEIQKTLKRFIDAEINPHVDEWEEAEIFPAHEVFKKLGNLGLLGLTKPEAFGGAGLDYSYAVAMAETLSRMMVQTARQNGLAGVYRDLLSYEGSEFYFTPVGPLAGKEFREAQWATKDAVVCGVRRAEGGKPAVCTLNPPDDFALQEGDELLVIAEDDDSFTLTAQHAPTVPEGFAGASAMQRKPERLLICGMHVHVGIEDPELRIDLMSQASYFLPHLLALSTSSPFWRGADTGLKSYRLAVFNEMPRTGLPEIFDSFGEYQRHLDVLVSAGLIEDGSKLWWDLRPSARFPTLEMRISDICTLLDDTIAIAAMFFLPRTSCSRLSCRVPPSGKTWPSGSTPLA